MLCLYGGKVTPEMRFTKKAEDMECQCLGPFWNCLRKHARG